MKKRTTIAICMLTILIFLLSTVLVHENSVCCAFSSTRYLGFPAKYLIVTKTTEDYNEAQKVFRLSTLTLLKQGWKLGFAVPLESPIISTPAINLGFDLIVSFILSYTVLRLLGILKCKSGHFNNSNQKE